MNLNEKRYITIILLLIIITSVTYSQAQPLEKNNYQIPKKEIINQGLKLLNKNNILEKNYANILQYRSSLLELEKWYNSHPMVEFASLIKSTITVKFIDDSYTILMDIFSTQHTSCFEYITKSYTAKGSISNYKSDINAEQTALILNPSEYLYGNLHCKRIINKLHKNGYNIYYLENEAVDLKYIKYQLTEEIVYMNTHAGYWDVDGDHQPDTVVIATGEHWTNKTTQIHQFEYENQMIVEGMVGKKSFVAFTPSLIEYYYQPEELPDSLIYMATCHATYDDSMANAFIESGANAYIGWNQNTVFWTNSLTSVLVFRLLLRGLTVQQVCKIIGYGSCLNFLLRSKLTYYGEGEHRIQKIIA